MFLAPRTNELHNAQRALLHAHEAVSTLTLEFLRYPSAYALLLSVLPREYLWLCKTAKQAPDVALLEPCVPTSSRSENA